MNDEGCIKMKKGDSHVKFTMIYGVPPEFMAAFSLKKPSQFFTGKKKTTGQWGRWDDGMTIEGHQV